jgi:hypothetical protein
MFITVYSILILKANTIKEVTGKSIEYIILYCTAGWVDIRTVVRAPPEHEDVCFIHFFIYRKIKVHSKSNRRMEKIHQCFNYFQGA